MSQHNKIFKFEESYRRLLVDAVIDISSGGDGRRIIPCKVLKARGVVGKVELFINDYIFKSNMSLCERRLVQYHSAGCKSVYGSVYWELMRRLFDRFDMFYRTGYVAPNIAKINGVSTKCIEYSLNSHINDKLVLVDSYVNDLKHIQQSSNDKFTFDIDGVVEYIASGDDIDKRLRQYVSFAYVINNKYFNSSKNIDNLGFSYKTGRCYRPYQILNKYMRSYIEIGGESTLQIDIKCSQPYIMYSLFDESEKSSYLELLRGDIYTCIDGVSRSDLKLAILKFLGGKSVNSCDYSCADDVRISSIMAKFADMMQKRFPKSYVILDSMRSIENRTGLINHLQSIEALIVLSTINDLNGALSVHDCIICSTSDEIVAVELLKKNFKKFVGVDPILTNDLNGMVYDTKEKRAYITNNLSFAVNIHQNRVNIDRFDGENVNCLSRKQFLGKIGTLGRCL